MVKWDSKQQERINLCSYAKECVNPRRLEKTAPADEHMKPKSHSLEPGRSAKAGFCKMAHPGNVLELGG